MNSFMSFGRDDKLGSVRVMSDRVNRAIKLTRGGAEGRKNRSRKGRKKERKEGKKADRKTVWADVLHECDSSMRLINLRRERILDVLYSQVLPHRFELVADPDVLMLLRLPLVLEAIEGHLQHWLRPNLGTREGEGKGLRHRYRDR